MEESSTADLRSITVDLGVESTRKRFAWRSIGLHYGDNVDGSEKILWHGTGWHETSQKERWSKLKQLGRWYGKIRPTDLRWRSSEEIGGHLFNH